jgi:nucleotide-binding universal stress UspA family protein
VAAPHRWIVAHDFSACAESAARTAARDLANTKEGGTLVLVHVYDVLPPPAAVDGAGAGAGLVTIERAVAQESARRLELFAEQLRKEIAGFGGSAIEVESVIRQGSPADTIVDEVKKRVADRVAVGTHGRTGLTRLLLGSIAERIVRLSPVPVLVVKST